MPEAEGEPPKYRYARRLRDLNDQYLSWVQHQHKNCRDQVWIDGAEAYVRHATNIKSELYSRSASAGVSTPLAENQIQHPGYSAQPEIPTSSEASARDNGGLTLNTAGSEGSSADRNGQAPLSEELSVELSTEVLFRATAGLHLQSPGKDLGAAQRPCHLVFTTEAGTVRLNSPLYKGLKPVKQDKGRLMMSLPMTEDNTAGSTPVLRVVLLKLKDSQQVDQLTLLLADNLPR